MGIGRRIGIVLATALTGATAACSHDAPATSSTNALPDWRAIATPADRDRLRHWRDAWMAALDEARAADPQAIAAESVLFAPDRALSDALPPAGAYKCRIFKLGKAGTALRAFAAGQWTRCAIEDQGDVLGFDKDGGVQRPVGLILHDSDARGVFLGTLELGDERTARQYGRDPQRDMAGFVERVAGKRWRIVLPYPHFEAKLDVIELVPATS